MLLHRWHIQIAMSVVCRIVFCGQMVQDRPIVCMEVEQGPTVNISIGTIFDPVGPA